MNWDIEFNQLSGTYQLVITSPYAIYELEANDYELALDEAGHILESIGFYEEA